jgi:hypothetical protein
MTPTQKIKAKILKLSSIEFDDSTVDEVYSAAYDDGDLEYAEEVREGEVETGIDCAFSRCYESKSVAAQMLDGSWVGWTYWYGGGKHGEPGSIPWMEEAYALECKEEEKLVVVRTFRKKT